MNVPEVILQLADYRRDIMKDIKSAETVKILGSAIQELEELKNEINQHTVQSRSKAVFLWAYEKLGYGEFKELMIKLKSMPLLSKEEYSQAKGVQAEIFLYATILEFIKRNSIEDWRVWHSYTLDYISGNGSTEIDLLIASRYMLVVFEVKSYGGSKVLDDVCEIHVGGRSHDIYAQNGNHCKALYEHIYLMALKNTGVMKSAFFSFSLGDLQDRRTPNSKRLLPVLTENSIVQFLEAVKRVSQVSWKDEIFEKLNSLYKTDFDMQTHITRIRRKYS
jgi:hypothetical protein